MKRIISLMLALVIVISAAVPAYATGDGNMDSGGSGMGDGTKTNYWNPGMDGVRLSVVHADNRAVIGSVVDWSNQKPNANIAHFGKVSKLSYNAGRTLSPAVGGYPYGWPDAGELTAGGAFSLAWRCLDAQFWGVAQRRKRIFLLADFAGPLAPQLLFDVFGETGNCWKEVT